MEKAKRLCSRFFHKERRYDWDKDFHLEGYGRNYDRRTFHNFIEQFYAKEIIPPGEIINRQRPDEMKIPTAWLKDKKGKRVKIITVPKAKA